MFSDGIIDQFNKEGDKLKTKRLKEIIHQFPMFLKMEEKRDFLEEQFVEWKEGVAQTDDVIFLGFSLF